MSSEKKLFSGKDGNQERPGIFQLKDTMILFGWICSILILAGACWILTQPVRNRFLIRAVNRVLEQSGDTRRLGEPSSPGTGSSTMGSWYSVTSAGKPEFGSEKLPGGAKVFVFSFIGEGTFFPCAAVVSESGKIEEFIPLNSHGERIFKRISPGILKLYTRRIEGVKS
jgi:hypothetical protein